MLSPHYTCLPHSCRLQPLTPASPFLPPSPQVGDYVLSPEICVERKAIPDLHSSMASGRWVERHWMGTIDAGGGGKSIPDHDVRKVGGVGGEAARAAVALWQRERIEGDWISCWA